MQYINYPIAFIFLGPIWLWMLWSFSSLSYEMEKLLQSATEDDEDSIAITKRAWNVFTGNTFVFMICFVSIGWFSYTWIQSNYDTESFLWQYFPAIIYVFITQILEAKFIRWNQNQITKQETICQNLEEIK